MGSTSSSSTRCRLTLLERDGRKERRGRDLNPRRTQKPETVFETAAFDRSATPPRDRGWYRSVVNAGDQLVPAHDLDRSAREPDVVAGLLQIQHLVARAHPFPLPPPGGC